MFLHVITSGCQVLLIVKTTHWSKTSDQRHYMQLEQVFLRIGDKGIKYLLLIYWEAKRLRNGMA